MDQSSHIPDHFDVTSAKVPNSDGYGKSWPVQIPVPMKSIYIKGSRQVRRRPYRFRYSNMKNWLMPLDGTVSIDHVRFLLDCFVISAGPVPPQLGRYHPQSDPEDFVPSDPLPEPSCSKDDDEDEEKTPLHRKAGPSNPWQDEDSDEFTFENYFPESGNDPSDEAIVRELSEMRLVLERLLDNGETIDWDMHPPGLRDVLNMLPEDESLPKEPSPHFPVGDWEFVDCGICYESQWLYRRHCCQFAACSSCLQAYYSAKVDDGLVKIECCSTECRAYVHRDEISARLTSEDKCRFHRLLVLANQDASTKTCPRCSHVTTIKQNINKKDPKAACVSCPSCQLEWCFECHAPWHIALSCKQFRKGDRLLRSWARQRSHGQLNAQRCPRCNIFIQRTTGCDHMHCTRCRTDFCYKCGERFRYLKFFGDHYSKLSVFGCKYRFKANKPLQRKAIRGAIFGSKLVAAPVLGALAVAAGAVAVGVSLFALPVYGGVQLYRHCEGRHSKVIRRQSSNAYHIPNVHLHVSHSFP